MAEAVRRLQDLAERGLLGDGVRIHYHDVINGPRAGAVLINCGYSTGEAYKALRNADSGLARQVIPWYFQDIQVYWQGAWVRIEAPWPEDLATNLVRLTDLLPDSVGHPPGNRVVVGIDEFGTMFVLALSREVPHALIAGTTGSGKTVLMRSIATQLLMMGGFVVLIDGKLVGLKMLEKAGGVIGPLAHETSDVIAALSWAVGEMERRYRVIAGKEPPRGNEGLRIYIVWDEFQEHLAEAAVEKLAFALASKGAEAGIHLVMATQHPLASVFGGEFGSVIKRQFGVRIALRVTDRKASEVILGDTEPDASKLAGAGDAYALWPGGRARIQCAYISEEDIRKLVVDWSGPIKAEWPAPATEPETSGNGRFSAAEIAAAIVAARNGRGRPYLSELLTRVGEEVGGTDRLRALLALGREIHQRLTDWEEMCATASQDTPSPPVSQSQSTGGAQCETESTTIDPKNTPRKFV